MASLAQHHQTGGMTSLLGYASMRQRAVCSDSFVVEVEALVVKSVHEVSMNVERAAAGDRPARYSTIEEMG